MPHHPFPRSRVSRVVVALSVCVLAVGSCGPSSGQDDANTSREVSLDGAYGEVNVPVTDEKVWALDPHAATELLAIGVTPVRAGRSDFEGDAANEARHKILSDKGVELAAPDQLEPILREEPTLIVGTQTPASDELIDKLEQIAPVLITASSLSWDKGLRQLGRATGHDQRANDVVAHLKKEVRTTRAELKAAGLDGETVSMMSACGTGGFCAYGTSRVGGTLLTELGFDRPTTHGQDKADLKYGYAGVSEEKVSDLLAPVVFILTGSVQAGAPSPLDNPLFDLSESTYGEVDFAAWYGASSFDVPWILNDVRAILLEKGEVTGKERGIALFEECARATS